MTTTYQPFANDLDHLEAEIEAIIAKCRRFGILRDIERDHQHDRRRLGVLGDLEHTSTEEERRLLAAAEAGEEATRASLNARLAVTREAGIVLALDRLVAEHGLDDTERTVIVLASIPAVSREMASCLDAISAHGYGSDILTIEGIANYLEMGFSDRIRLRHRFQPHAPLVRDGLVSVDLGHTCGPQDWPDATIRLTTATFNALVGVSVKATGTGDEQCGRRMAL